MRADAFNLPFRDESFATVVADPPYAGKNRGKKGVDYRAAGYVPYAGREWRSEAWRVLRPSGHLYVFCAVRELWDWFKYCTDGALVPHKLVDILCWCAPNNPSLSAYWRRGIGGRVPTWRPILHWQKEPQEPIRWPAGGETTYVFGGKRPLKTRSGEMHSFVDPNVFITSSIQSNMHESEPWPNQLPVRLLKWLLRPHAGPVLDLFSGTGTSRVAAISLGLDVVSVEMSEQALEIIRQRGAQLPIAGRI